MSFDKDALIEAYEAVRSDGDERNWVVFKYDGNNIVADSMGTEFDEFRSKFGDDDRGYGYLRVTSGDEMSQRAKFVFLTWVGPNVSAMKRAKMSTEKGKVKHVIKIASVDLLFDTEDDFTLEHIMDRVKRAGGANYGTGNGAE